MKTFRTTLAALIILAATGWSPAVLAQGDCVSDIRQLPADAQAVTLPVAMQRAGISGQVISAQLCQSGAGYVYRVRVRGANGEVKSTEIPAN